MTETEIAYHTSGVLSSTSSTRRVEDGAHATSLSEHLELSENPTVNGTQ